MATMTATATTAVTNGRTDVVLVGEAAFVADVAGAALEAESELPRCSSRECKTKKTLTIPTVSKNQKQFIDDEEEESEEEGEIKAVRLRSARRVGDRLDGVDKELCLESSLGGGARLALAMPTGNAPPVEGSDLFLNLVGGDISALWKEKGE